MKSPNAIQHRALDIPEILYLILKCTNNATLANVAQTNKDWSEPALDTLWRDMKWLHPLVSLLGRLVKKSNESWVSVKLLCKKFVPFLTGILLPSTSIPDTLNP